VRSFCCIWHVSGEKEHLVDCGYVQIWKVKTLRPGNALRGNVHKNSDSAKKEARGERDSES